MQFQVVRGIIAAVLTAYAVPSVADVRLYSERITCVSEFRCSDAPIAVGVVSTRAGETFTSSSACRADLINQLAASDACSSYALIDYSYIREFRDSCAEAWANYAVGQTFTKRMTSTRSSSSTADPITTTSETTQTVTAVSYDEVTIEILLNGSTSSSITMTRANHMSNCHSASTESPEVASGRATITVPAGTFDTTWQRVESSSAHGTTTTTAWTTPIGRRNVRITVKSETVLVDATSTTTILDELLSYSGY